MKISVILIAAMICAGCVMSRPQTLTSQQATALALQLANDKASAAYQCQPFHDGQMAHLVDGHWVWNGQSGYGRADLEATVLLAANGSAPTVKLQLLDNRAGFLPPQSGGVGRGGYIP